MLKKRFIEKFRKEVNLNFSFEILIFIVTEKGHSFLKLIKILTSYLKVGYYNISNVYNIIFTLLIICSILPNKNLMTASLKYAFLNITKLNTII